MTRFSEGRSNRGSRRRSSYDSYEGTSSSGYPSRGRRLPTSKSNEPIKFNTGTIAVLAGVLILGVGIGSAITSTTDGGQGNIASQQQLDMAVPDPEFCRQWGASAFVIDVEMYTTLNPSTVLLHSLPFNPGVLFEERIGPCYKNKVL